MLACRTYSLDGSSFDAVDEAPVDPGATVRCGTQHISCQAAHYLVGHSSRRPRILLSSTVVQEKEYDPKCTMPAPSSCSTASLPPSCVRTMYGVGSCQGCGSLDVRWLFLCWFDVHVLFVLSEHSASPSLCTPSSLFTSLSHWHWCSVVVRIFFWFVRSSSTWPHSCSSM